MRFSKYLTEKAERKSVDGYEYYLLDVRQDSFIHFTTDTRAREIIKNNGLAMNPPDGHFGPSGVFAISTTFGELVPSVQLTHLDKRDTHKGQGELVAIHFTTRIPPTYGSKYKEEVVWSNTHGVNDKKIRQPINKVEFDTAEIISIEKAKSMLGRNTYDELDVYYDEQILNRILEGN